MSYWVNQMAKIFFIILLTLFTSFSIVSADSQRDIAIDLAIGGMKEGSRVLPPGAYGKETAPDVSGKALSPGMDAGVIASAPAAEKTAIAAADRPPKFVFHREYCAGPITPPSTSLGSVPAAAPK